LRISNLQTDTPKKFEDLLIDNRYGKANPQVLGLILLSQIRKFLGVPVNKLQIHKFSEGLLSPKIYVVEGSQGLPQVYSIQALFANLDSDPKPS
jgi:hypothetical protein